MRTTWFIVPLALAGLVAAAGGGPAAKTPANPGWVPVTIVYEGDVGGKIEPCG